MNAEIKKITLAVPHVWLNPLRKQAFRLKLSIEDFLSMGLVEFIRNLPDAYLNHLEEKLPNPLEKNDDVFETISWTIHVDWANVLEIEAKALEVTPLTLLYVSLLWLADLPEDDAHLVNAKQANAWLSSVGG